jgi:hypothetical protein
MRYPLNVFFTVDTEFHPLDGRYSERTVRDDIARDIDGRTPQGDFGAFFQAEVLREHGLKGVFFVEALSQIATSSFSLKTVVERIQSSGHEVALHLHPEWLRRVPSAFSHWRRDGSLMRDFSLDEQTALIAMGVDQLHVNGVEKVYSFRAGGYGANHDTLRALAANGVPYDSSHNQSWLGVTCDVRTARPLLQPMVIDGTYEFPVLNFEDWPGHWRHAELCACSSAELEFALHAGWNRGWHSFVIVSHSFEMIKARQSRSTPPWYPDKMVVSRFRRLCRFLGSNRDKFRTKTFVELDLSGLPLAITGGPLKGAPWNTARRIGEQVFRKIS